MSMPVFGNRYGKPRIPTSDEEGITRENCTLIAILEEVADAVLCMTRRVQGLHLDTFANGESLAVAWSLVDLGAVLAANDRD